MKSFEEDPTSYEKFTTLCDEKGLKIGHVINKLISLFNKDPEVIN